MPKLKSPRERTPFGRRMRAAREWARMTQEQARKAVGCSQSTLAELESSAQGSSLVVRFAETYQVDASWLANGPEDAVVLSSAPAHAASHNVQPLPAKTSGDAAWPFNLVDRKRWDACNPEERGYVQSALNRALGECEAMRAGKRRAV